MIQIRFRSGVFQPRLVPTLLVVLMLSVLLGLGTWQVQRLHWKEALLQTIADRVHDAPLEIPFVGISQADYRPATATGTFRHDLSFYLLATDLVTGQGGYHVLTPFVLTKGQNLLVDRGWIPYDRKGQADGFTLPAGVVELQGIIRVPTAPGWIMPKNDPARGNWYSIDLPAMAATDKLDEFLPYVLEVNAADNASELPKGGQTHLTLPNDHFSYAVTWYGFALILVIIYALSSYRKNSED